MYVAVKGGEKAIENADKLLAERRRGDHTVPALSIAQIREQLSLAVDRVMAEGSLYDPDLAALAIKQAEGDLVEAIFLLRAYRTTLTRFAYSDSVDTGRMGLQRRISAIFKDLPGGQMLGPTYDYTHRLLNFALAAEDLAPPQSAPEADTGGELAEEVQVSPRVPDILGAQGLLEEEREDNPDAAVFDITRDSLSFPASRDQRLQVLARGDEGFLLGLGYSVQRGYGRTHPFVGEIRMGAVAVEIEPAELGFTIDIGDIVVTECQMVNQFGGSKEQPPQFTRGYGLTLGHNERKAMAMALVDRSLRAKELGEIADDEAHLYPAQDEEFVLYHADNVEAQGFVSHLKLPHYVDFQSELELVRRLRAEAEAGNDAVAAEAAE